MQLHELKNTKKERIHKRIGRGGKRGSYSGRGVKGQHSRAGRRLRPAERDLIMRLPKRRGFANKEKRDKEMVFNLGDLSLSLKAHANAKSPVTLTIAFLKEAELVPMNYRGGVKILGMGEVQVPVVVDGLKISKSAQAKIEKAGGKIIQPSSQAAKKPTAVKIKKAS